MATIHIYRQDVCSGIVAVIILEYRFYACLLAGGVSVTAVENHPVVDHNGSQ